MSRPPNGRDALSVSDPERFSKSIRGNDGLSAYCDFYEWTRKECAEDLRSHPIKNDTHAAMDVYFNYQQFVKSDCQFALAVFYCTLALVSFVTTSGFVFLLLKQRKDFRYPIYQIIMHLSTSYSLISFSQIFVNIPIYLLDVKANDLVGRIAFFINQFAVFAAVFLYFLLAINRLAILSCYRLNFLFKGKQKNRTIAFGWSLALGAAVFTLYYGCRKTYDTHNMIFYDDCTPPSLSLYRAYEKTTEDQDKRWDEYIVRTGLKPLKEYIHHMQDKVLFYSYYALPVISFLLYIYIGYSIGYIRTDFSKNANRKVEIDLLIQSAVTLLFYMATMSLYFLQFEFSQLWMVYIYDMFINILEVLTGIIFVAIFAIGNKTVKKAVRNMWFPKRSSSVMPVKVPIVFHNNGTPSVEFPVVAYSS